MGWHFRFRTTRAISTWPQSCSKPHTSSAATAERSLKKKWENGQLCYPKAPSPP